MQAAANPYATPNALVEDQYSNEGFGDINIFTAKGRMGRLRYFLYSMIVGIVGMVILALASMLGAISPILGGIAVAVVYIGMIVLSFFLAIQRCHDFNKSGWLSLIIFIPFAQLVLYFIPGTKGGNQYGLQPPNNTKGTVAASIILPVVMILFMGIIASIALPAYSDYVQRAQAASQHSGQAQ